MVYGEVFTLSDGHHVHNHLLFLDSVDDSHRFPCCVVTQEERVLRYDRAGSVSNRLVSPCILRAAEADTAGAVGGVAVVTV